MGKRAIIHALWIGEAEPDAVSRLIQRVIRRDYSHNAFIYEKTGHLWEATFGDDQCGVVEQKDLHKALHGCIIRARKRVILNVTEEVFERFLERERGKPYAHGQNLSTIFSWTRPWTKNGVKQRHCSELLAAAAFLGGFRFPRNKDSITPADTFRVIEPDIVNEVINSGWTFLP